MLVFNFDSLSVVFSQSSACALPFFKCKDFHCICSSINGNLLWGCCLYIVKNIVFVGDSGYPSEPWLLVPYPNHPHENQPEGRFNRRHCSARNCVERGIGVFKARFRCCRRERALHYFPNMAGKKNCTTLAV